MANTINPKEHISAKGVIIVVVLLILLFVINKSIETVPVGRVAVGTLFGSATGKQLDAGLHVVNPLYRWTLFDVREKTHEESANVPTQDQLLTQVHVSVQYRVIPQMASSILKETGQAEQAINVHLVPKLRSVIREQGKSIPRAEDFFKEETQDRLQRKILEELVSYLNPKGIEVRAVLIRDISLPPFITKAIESKKEREQEVEKQKAELERFKTEQEQQVAAAMARRRAAEEEAARKRVLADAQAYEITQLSEAIGTNPSYIKLQAIEALKAISRDPASKVYFLNGESPNPLPLMLMGDDSQK